MGSVKDLEIIQSPNDKELGRGRFNFSDRYSVFDWGEMPDHIDGKGAALCITSAYFFERLAEKGVGTHYLGVVEDGKAKKLSDLKNPVRKVCKNGGKLTKASESVGSMSTTPVRRMDISEIPIKALQMLPNPPVKSVPPTTAAAMTVNSISACSATRTVLNWLKLTMPATPAITLLMIKHQILTRLTLTPCERAASTLPPAAKT